MSRHPWLAAIVALLVAAGLAGCAKKSGPTAVTGLVVTPPPVANSPTAAVDLLRWAYDQRSIDSYRTLFTDDFAFEFSPLDPARDAFANGPWGRTQELLSAQHMFATGTATEQAANAITLDFNSASQPIADQRPGKTARWHRQLTVSIVLDVRRPSSSLQAKGVAMFFLVRGDSARVDGACVAADSLRWYVEGWLDETASTAPPAAVGRTRPFAPLPAGSSTWGGIKVRYL